MGFGHFFVLLSTMTQQYADTAHPVDYRLEVSPCARGDRARRDTAWLCGIARDGTWSYLFAYPTAACILRVTALVVTNNGRSPRLERRRSGLTSMRRMLQALAAAVHSGVALAAELPANEYPTAARADYVFGCMQVNGQTRDALERCSCSIDVIASLLPYEQYEEAETVMRVRQRGGKNASMFLTMPMLRAKVDELKRAQVEAELRCF
jgi:hypothetical protein